MSQEELLYTIALNILYRNKIIKELALLDRYGSAREVCRHENLNGLDEALALAQKELAWIEEHKIDCLYYKDTEKYPYRLAQCPDLPVMLYTKGNVELNKGHFISVVGTRTATAYGKDMAAGIVKDLAAAVPNLTIVSGLAYGIDITAHKAALEAGIPTIAVLGHGLDRIYPALHRNYAIATLEKGGLVTEYTSGNTPEGYNFIARDRIIAGLSDCTLVVESAARGGSLLTAHMAFDYNRDVFAVPGRMTDEHSKGCNNLIKLQKAFLVTAADDIINYMNWDTRAPQTVQTEIEDLFTDLNEEEKKILHFLRAAEDGAHINQIIIEVQLDYATVSSTLMMLELKDLIKGLPGGMYRAVR